MKPLQLEKKYALWGWLFIAPATILIACFSFLPMFQAAGLSFYSGIANNLRFNGGRNYLRLLQDNQFKKSVANVFTYLIFQVPIMLVSALILASILNSKKLPGKEFFRTLVFLPVATSLVATGIIFRSLFSLDGFVNFLFTSLKIVDEPVKWLADPILIKVVVIIVITWRWTGYNTIFYLAGFQNISSEVYEAATIDGAGPVQQFFRITLPLLKPVIILTTIMSTNGTLQIFDEPRVLTTGTTNINSQSISQYIYNLSFVNNPQFGYAAAASYTILFMVAILSLIQIKIGDRS
ncbi:lactose ABC transporter permease [Spirochaetia bacterium]|nr:lactose ABC transporter permease [Spirochaetia bacterium]